MNDGGERRRGKLGSNSDGTQQRRREEVKEERDHGVDDSHDDDEGSRRRGGLVVCVAAVCSKGVALAGRWFAGSLGRWVAGSQASRRPMSIGWFRGLRCGCQLVVEGPEAPDPLSTT